MSYQEVRRRRRRRLLAALVGLVLILAVAYAVTRWQSEQQATREYLDRALDFADGEADLGGRLADLVARMEQIGRPGTWGRATSTCASLPTAGSRGSTTCGGGF